MKYRLYLTLFCIFLGSTPANAELMVEKGKTLLAIFAHPDDETTTSPLLAKYAREGVNVKLVVVTDGQAGVRAHANIPAGEALKKVREKEAECATEALDIEDPIFLNYVDGTVSKRENVEKLNVDIARLFSEIKPDIVLTWGPEGGYGHPDHRMVGSVVAGVFQKGGEGWPKMVFFPAVTPHQLHNFDVAKSNFGKYLQMAWGITGEDYLPYRIPFSDEDFSRARKAYSCHKSQFTATEMEDLNAFLSTANGVSYLRPSHQKSEIKENLF